MTAAEQIAAYQSSMTEAQFQRRIIDLATLYGWRCTHFRPAQVRNGRWVTPLEGAAGWPDLALARHGRLLLVEVKARRGVLSHAQLEWIEALGGLSDGSELAGCGEFEVYVWKPADWSEIERVLRPETEWPS